MESTGAYTADRAAALSGVPKSTVYAWARVGVLVPTVSSRKLHLWSYTDLMGLRVIYWLRQNKTKLDGTDIPATSMPAVKRALKALSDLDLPLWSGDGSAIRVDGSGRVFIADGDKLADTSGQVAIESVLQPTAPFETSKGVRGPDLVKPRPTLRIHPGRLAGSPHVADTRVETLALSALKDAGYTMARIALLYPFLSRSQISDSLDLESQLKTNLLRAA